VGAGPLEPDRAPVGVAGEHRGLEGRVVRPVVPVAPGPGNVRHVDVLDRQTEEASPPGLVRGYAPGRAPHGEPPVDPLRDRARRTDRTVQEVGARVRRTNHLAGRRCGAGIAWGFGRPLARSLAGGRALQGDGVVLRGSEVLAEAVLVGE